MKTFLRVIALVIISCIVGFVLFFEFNPEAQISLKEATSSIALFIHDNKPAKDGIAIPITIQTIKEDATTSPSVSVEYPQFGSGFDDLNTTIKNAVTSRLDEFRQYVWYEPDNHNYSFTASWKPEQVNTKYISLIIRFDAYTGGAHENQDIETFNYDVVNKKFLSIEDLKPSDTDLIAKISKYSYEQLSKNIGTSSDAKILNDAIAVGTQALPQNFRNFTFTENAVSVYFPKYSVLPGSFGEQLVVFPLR